MLTLTIEKRDMKAKLDALRKSGSMPGVFYGRKEASTPISLVEKDFIKVWKQAGETSVIILKDGATEHEALIQEVDLDPVRDTPRHVDFYVVEKGKKLKLKVPVEFTGVSEAVKSLGGILVKVLREVEIEALPRDLPHSLIADLSLLKTLESVITAKDIKLAEGVTLMAKPDDVVVSITVAKEEVEEVAPVDAANIEVVDAKGKKPVEGEAAAPAPAADAKKDAPKK